MYLRQPFSTQPIPGQAGALELGIVSTNPIAIQLKTLKLLIYCLFVSVQVGKYLPDPQSAPSSGQGPCGISKGYKMVPI